MHPVAFCALMTLCTVWNPILSSEVHPVSGQSPVPSAATLR